MLRDEGNKSAVGNTLSRAAIFRHVIKCNFFASFSDSLFPLQDPLSVFSTFFQMIRSSKVPQELTRSHPNISGNHTSKQLIYQLLRKVEKNHQK